MCYSSVLLWVCLCLLVKCGAGSNWCYTGCAHTPTTWGELPGSFCGGKRQSPIDIVTSDVQTDPNLHNFTFINFLSQRVESITNDGHTVKCLLEQNGAEIGGGGFNGTYSSINFHFHWGDTQYHPGSEHTVDGERYPVEMHIVSLRKGLTMAQALADPQGIAVFGFFINATDDGDMSGPWSMLTSYLSNVTDAKAPVNGTISINDLIGKVDLSKFYRYAGSLTTPICTEAVVWTVFHDPININKNLIQRFPTRTGLTNVYRPTQALNKRYVFASPATSLPQSHLWCYDHCAFSVSSWNHLPHSSCGGAHQSPINIDTRDIVTDKSLDAFTFTNFDNKNAIQSITNTGHTVTCCLRENMVEVSGGGLGHVYSTLQLHFHWGTAHDSGSEHTVDSKQYLMEMHIVSKRKDLTLDEAMHTTNGLAVLGFFIETNTTSIPVSVTNGWKALTDQLSAIHNISAQVDVTTVLSIDDLLGNVNRHAYYRYNGSLTTPSCNEVVTWTLFKEPVKVERNLLTMFPNQMGYSRVFRPPQPLNKRTVFTSTSPSSTPGPIVLFLLLAWLQLFM